MQDLSNLVVYNDGELELKVSVDSETIWLTQLQMSQLFDKSCILFPSKFNLRLYQKNIPRETNITICNYFNLLKIKSISKLIFEKANHFLPKSFKLAPK